VQNFRWVLIVVVCLGITAPDASWADPAQADDVDLAQADEIDLAHADWVEDPYAPHVTRGNTVRLGSAVGFLYGERLDVLALGATAAFGHRFGRFAIEAELDVLTLQAKGPSSQRLGDAERLGVVARLDVVRLGPRWVGANSLLALYIEGGAGVAWNHWYRPAYDEPMRVVPEDTKRVEGQAGFGVALDHRLQEPIGFPRRIGWFLGWRLALAPHETGAANICRGAICRVAPAMPEQRFTDRSMLFQSSLSVTW
jgi:hypothetical protein